MRWERLIGFDLGLGIFSFGMLASAVWFGIGISGTAASIYTSFLGVLLFHRDRTVGLALYTDGQTDQTGHPHQQWASDGQEMGYDQGYSLMREAKITIFEALCLFGSYLRG